MKYIPGERLEVWLSLNFCTTLSHEMAAFFSVTKNLYSFWSRITLDSEVCVCVCVCVCEGGVMGDTIGVFYRGWGVCPTSPVSSPWLGLC